MATVSILKALTGYFNVDAGKREAKVWVAEMRALTREEKIELAQGVCAITGDTLDVATR